MYIPTNSSSFPACKGLIESALPEHLILVGPDGDEHRFYLSVMTSPTHVKDLPKKQIEATLMIEYRRADKRSIGLDVAHALVWEFFQTIEELSAFTIPTCSAKHTALSIF